MIFLNPVVLFGLIAASIPVIIHLLNLRKLKKINFSTLKFLNELQKNKIRRVKLKQWLLLALRMLIILFLVTAFARPTLEGVSIGGTTSAAKTTAVFVLDDTFSMSVIGQNGSYFNQAKQIIKNLINELEEGDDAALILVSGNKSEEVGLSANLKKFAGKVDNITVSDASGFINNALIRAANLISQSKNFNKEIYLLTDFQANRIADKNNITDLSKLLNDKVRLYSFDFAGRDVYNIGVNELKINTQIFEKNKPISFKTGITNYSQEPANNLVVSLFMNNERSAQRSINLQPGESSTVILDADVKSTGFVDALVEIEDDDILQDNVRYTAFYIPDEIQVLLAYENKDDSRFVKLALNSGGTNGNLKITEKKLSLLNSTQLNNFDVLFIIGNNFAGSKQKVNEFLQQGKGVVIFPGAEFNESVFKASLSSLKLPSQIQLINAGENSNSVVDFDKVDFNHPIFQNIFRDKKKKEIESPKIFSYYKINPGTKGKPVIKLIDGSSFLSEFDVSDGRILLFNVAPVLRWSDFPVKSIFAPLVYKSVYYLSSGRSQEADYLAGEQMNINISGRTLPQIKIVKPDKEEEFININENTSADFISYSNTYSAGLYKIYSGDKILETISVNVDPAESVTKYLKGSGFDEYLKEIKFGGKYLKIDLNEDISQIILQARFGSELWRYFLLAALILALIEMTIARSAKKELTEATG